MLKLLNILCGGRIAIYLSVSVEFLKNFTVNYVNGSEICGLFYLHSRYIS